MHQQNTAHGTNKKLHAVRFDKGGGVPVSSTGQALDGSMAGVPESGAKRPTAARKNETDGDNINKAVLHLASLAKYAVAFRQTIDTQSIVILASI